MQEMRQENQPEQNGDMLRLQEGEVSEVREDVLASKVGHFGLLELRFRSAIETQNKLGVDGIVSEIAYRLRHNLKQNMRKKGLNTKTLAEACGISQQTVQFIFSGRTSPSFNVLVRMMIVTGTSLDGIIR